MYTFVEDTIVLRLKTGIDILPYEVKKIKFVKPDGTPGSWDASVCPEDNTVMTVAVGNALDLRGTWRVQAYVERDGQQFHGKWVDFDVFSPIPLS